MAFRSVLTLGGSILLTLGLSLPIATPAAQAGTLNAIDILNTYNLVVFGDLNTTSEVDGRAFISGDLNGSTSNYATHNAQLPASTVPALTVGGNINAGVNVNGPGLAVGGNVAGPVNLNQGGDMVVRGNVASNVNANFNGKGTLYVKGSVKNNSTVNANGGSAYIGGTVESGSHVNANGGGTLHQNSSVPDSHLTDIAAQAAEMKNTLAKQSNYFASLKAHASTIVVGSNTATFHATPHSNGQAIFNITDPSSVFSQGQFSFDYGSATSLVINVFNVGDTLLTIGANFLNGIATSMGKNTIWNFVDAKNIHITSQFGGNIIALLANITIDGNVEGSVVAKAVTQHNEIHYDGQVIVPTPIPAALPMFGAALAGLVGWRRMRRQPGARLAA
jgi:choice-of-anchor A domain-containing protein